MSDDPRAHGIQSPNHALLCGIIWGALMKIEQDHPDMGKFEALPVIEGGGYTNQLIIERPSAKYLVEIHQMEATEEDYPDGQDHEGD